MPAAENLEVARRYLAALSSGATADALEQFLAPDIVQEEFPNRITPNGARRDLAALKEGRARGLTVLRSEYYELTNAVGHGEQLALEVTWSGTVRDTIGPFAAGQVLRARLGIFMEFRDGRIVRQHNYDCIDPW